MYEETTNALQTEFSRGVSRTPRSIAPGQWVSIELLHATQSVISQVICRLLVGKAVARHSKFTQKVADFSYSVVLWAIIFDWCPALFRPWVSWMLPIKRTKRAISRVLRHHIVECIGFPMEEAEGGINGKGEEQVRTAVIF
jgi:hypothetical protein